MLTGVRVREPSTRPLDVVAVELSLTAAQAFLVGVLLYLAVGLWDDAGVGLGTVAAILVLLGLAVGAGWAYWLAGGVGWPMAAANLVAAIFLGSTLVMGWMGDDFRVGGVPLLLATAAATFGVAAGAFLDSPRRWRWDQRRQPRAGTTVPAISPTTRAMAARVPRSLPHRKPAPEPLSPLAVRIGQAPPPVAPRSEPAVASTAPTAAETAGGPAELGGSPEPELTDAPPVAGAPLTVPEAPEPVLPTARLSRSRTSAKPPTIEVDDGGDGIVLPTMIEPKAQRSPWAWAAPPEWSRDEDDEPVTRPSQRA
jgi:hypothetical protein